MNAHQSGARAAVLALALAGSCLTSPAAAQSGAARRTSVTPYIGIDQVVMGPLKGEGDVLTYTNVSAGVTAQVSSRRLEAQIDVRYDHSFGWGDQLGDQDVLSGIIQGRYNVARGLSIDAGGFATRIRSDGFSGATPQRDSLTSQVYAGYIGPSYVTQVGDIDLSASYRLGYTRVEDDAGIPLPGSLSGRTFDDSFSHSLAASAGVAPGVLLPVGLVASAGYDREDARQLDQRFEDIWGRIDATLPVSPTVALVGGVGYEKIKISQRSPLLDSTGVPVIDDGRYVTDDNSPRALLYDNDGLIWDAGVLWRPSRRTSLEARVGERYGSMTYSGSFSWQTGRNSSFSLAVFDGIDSFGRLLTSNVASLSGNVNVVRNPFTGDLAGCAFAPSGGGQCFNDALSGVTDANFRYRGVAAQYSTAFGPWNWGVGVGYSRRKFITPDGDTVYIAGSSDENWYANTSLDYRIDSMSSISGVIYFSHFNAGSGGRLDTTNFGAFTSYYRNLTRRLSASASVGVDSAKTDQIDAIISAMGQVGLRYSF